MGRLSHSCSFDLLAHRISPSAPYPASLTNERRMEGIFYAVQCLLCFYRENDKT